MNEYDITEEPAAEEPAERELTFIADGKLSRLTKYLRILGLDCKYDGGNSLPENILISAAENRILLTCKLVAGTTKVRPFVLASRDLKTQLNSIASGFNIQPHIRPFTRCLCCNCILESITDADRLADIIKLIPKSVVERHLDISFCFSCGRPYWQGSHIERMLKRLEEFGLKIVIQGL